MQSVGRMRRTLEGLLALGLGAAMVMLIVAKGATGATACNNARAHPCALSQIQSRDTAFLNYDFTEEDHSRHKVDWPVDLVFWNLSSVARIRRVLQYDFPAEGDAMYGYVNNAHGWRWNSNKGLKTHWLEPFGDAYHFRIYSPPRFAPHSDDRQPARERMFNYRWGFYNIATAHIDHDEGFFGQWSGNSEKAEKTIARVWGLRTAGNGSVARDWIPMDNFEEPHTEGDHHWRNNGMASKLRVPSLAEIYSSPT